jgi:glycosyltransferase involved in cell wall biosynthesis
MNAQSQKQTRRSWRFDKDYKVYPDGPPRSEYERIKREIQRTGRPEDVEELFFGEVDPEKGFDVLIEFEFDRKLRKDGSLSD